MAQPRRPSASASSSGSGGAARRPGRVVRWRANASFIGSRRRRRPCAGGSGRPTLRRSASARGARSAARRAGRAGPPSRAAGWSARRGRRRAGLERFSRRRGHRRHVDRAAAVVARQPTASHRPGAGHATPSHRGVVIGEREDPDAARRGHPRRTRAGALGPVGARRVAVQLELGIQGSIPPDPAPGESARDASKANAASAAAARGAIEGRPFDGGGGTLSRKRPRTLLDWPGWAPRVYMHWRASVATSCRGSARDRWDGRDLSRAARGRRGVRSCRGQVCRTSPTTRGSAAC